MRSKIIRTRWKMIKHILKNDGHILYAICILHTIKRRKKKFNTLNSLSFITRLFLSHAFFFFPSKLILLRYLILKIEQITFVITIEEFYYFLIDSEKNHF